MQIRQLVAVGVAWSLLTLTAIADPPTDARGWLELALREAASVEDVPSRAAVAYSLGKSAATQGMWEAAERAASWIDNPQLRFYVLKDIVVAADKAGDRVAALRALNEARSVIQGWQSAFGTMPLADLYVDLGMVDEAKAFARSLDEQQRRFTLSQIATRLAARGNLAGALAIAEQEISSENWRDSVTASIASFTTDVAALRTVLPRIRDPKNRDRALTHGISLLLKDGKPDEARALLEQISSDEVRGGQEALLVQAALPQDIDGLERRLREERTREPRLAIGNELLKKLLGDGKNSLVAGAPVAPLGVEPPPPGEAPSKDRLRRAEQLVEQMIAIVRDTPRPTQVTKFGTAGDDVLIQGLEINLARVAVGYYRSGEHEQAERLYRRALAAAAAIPDSAGLAKVFLLASLDPAGKAMPELPSVLQPGPELPRPTLEFLAPMARLQAVEKEVLKQIADGAFDQVLRTAEPLLAPPTGDNDPRRTLAGDAHGHILKALIEFKQFDLVLAYLKRMSVVDDANGYLLLSDAMFDAGEAARLESWLDQLAPAVRAQLCVGAARYFQRQP